MHVGEPRVAEYLRQNGFKRPSVVIGIAEPVDCRDFVPQRAMKNLASSVGVKLGYLACRFPPREAAAQNPASGSARD